MAPNFNVKLITDPLEAGDSIYWEQKGECVYFVDSERSELYKHCPKSNKTTKCKVGQLPKLGFVFPVGNKKNTFIAGLKRYIISFTWNGIKNTVPTFTKVGEVDNEEDLETNCICGAKVDPSGRLWIGTMGSNSDGSPIPNRGSLYSIKGGELKKHLSFLGMVKGFAWDNKLMKMYYTDSLTTTITSYDYSPDDGAISNKIIIFDSKRNGVDGFPAGLALDVRGNLWVAMIHGFSIIQIDPVNSKLLQTITMPTAQVTSLSFGYKTMDALFVTTAKAPDKAGQAPEHPAGCTCLIEAMGVKGTPAMEYSL